jgi:hypothetical protein
MLPLGVPLVPHGLRGRQWHRQTLAKLQRMDSHIRALIYVARTRVDASLLAPGSELQLESHGVKATRQHSLL